MAKLYKGSNALRNKKYKYIILSAVMILLSAAIWSITAVYFYKNGILNFTYILCSSLTTGFAAVITHISKRQIKIIHSGITGEKAAKQLVRCLSDDYRIITNARITYNGKTSETDMIVVGTNGVFIIEVKNHNQKITGNAQSHNWTQFKTGRGGGKYSKQFYNPIKQVSTHIYRLANILRKSGFNIWVQGIVYFSNPTAQVSVENMPEDIPIITANRGGLKKLAEYITAFNSGKTLSAKDINEMVKIIK